MIWNKTNFKTALFWIVIVAVFPSMSGCFGSSEALEQWMVAQRGNTPLRIEQISEPKKFIPQAYEQMAAMEPFNNQKLLQALRRDSAQSAANLALISPELARRKETLESFPLDTVAMVGSLHQNNALVGLIRVEKLLYQVKVGNYVGQNYGRITKITDSEIELREIAQDAAGEWTERKVNLQLQAKEK